MLFHVFRSLGIQFLVICGLIAISALIALATGGKEAAVKLLDFAVLQTKGPWVWTFGFGLATFISAAGRMLPASLNGVLEPNQATAAATVRLEQATKHRNAWRYTGPITFLGVFLTAMYGVPHQGIPYALMFIGVCSIYYVGAFLLFYFVEVTLAFNILFERMESISFRRVYSPIHLENLTTFLAITTTLGLLGIYVGFRGTLTANFEFSHPVWKAFLTTPIMLFLPGTLFYNYYPRYVLRKIIQYKVFTTMSRLGNVDTEDAKSLLLDLKETAILESQILPFLDYKSLPSYLVAIVFAISIAYSNDPAIKAFSNFLISFGSE